MREFYSKRKRKKKRSELQTIISNNHVKQNIPTRNDFIDVCKL